jgi:N-acetylglucosamine kinase-like BadF-type ATPase
VKIAIGVDGGGSNTVALRHGDGATARGGPSNPSALGVDGAAQTIASVIRQLARQDAQIFIGAAGAGRSEIAAALEERVRALLGEGCAIHVEGDARIALRASVPEGPGVVLRVGTGSFAYAEDGERAVRVGGAGYLLGDEGSGYAIGLAALRAYVKILEGRLRDDELAACAAAATEAHDRDAVLRFAYGGPASISAIASVAPALIDLAGKGHRAATRIAQGACSALADLAKAAAATAGLLDREPSVALSGGLMRRNTLLSYLVETRIAADIPGAAIVRSHDGDGAARAAARLAAESLACTP